MPDERPQVSVVNGTPAEIVRIGLEAVQKMGREGWPETGPEMVTELGKMWGAAQALLFVMAEGEGLAEQRFNLRCCGGKVQVKHARD